MSQPKPRRSHQPILSDASVILHAPVQCWSRSNGDCSAPIDGLYLGDVRHLSEIQLRVAESPIEWVSSAESSASEAVSTGLLRGADSDQADAKLRLVRSRRVTSEGLHETLEVQSHLPDALQLSIDVLIRADSSPMTQIKDGRVGNSPVAAAAPDSDTTTFRSGGASAKLSFSGAQVSTAGDRAVATWHVSVPAYGSASMSWRAELEDDRLVVSPAKSAWPPVSSVVGLSREDDYARWAWRAWDDLGALRLTLPGSTDEFFAAGAPWFFTLFGRDSIWAARLLLPLKPDIAVSTLRVLASMQGTKVDRSTAEEPGKILHELRAGTVELTSEGIKLPPIYYGSVDSTPLWVLLLADAWRAGAPEREIMELIPALRSALMWITEYGDADGDGFLDYIDESGQGLSNQGWKDSGDSIQWRDGTLAAAPIALSEVQAYAYEAARAGADLLERAKAAGGNSESGDQADSESDDTPITPNDLRQWAEALKQRFREHYWVSTEEGHYPAIALDRDKRPVDSLTSNIGHLLGTGLLDPEEELRVADLLVDRSMLSGFGVRTLSDSALGYWPISYHAGSVWTHDTAIILAGMMKAGLVEQAAKVRDGMRATAVSFDYRVPELHSGDGIDLTPKARPYPASCRPQAWSAAAAFVALRT